MNELAKFFKDTHKAAGVFYPLHCLVAVMDDLSVATHARRILLDAGFSGDDVIAVEGRALLELEAKETTMATSSMQMLSRGLGCEQVSTDHNLEFARKGNAFVFVHCPDASLREKAWRVLEPERPVAAHYYGRLFIDHVACSFQTT